MIRCRRRIGLIPREAVGERERRARRRWQPDTRGTRAWIARPSAAERSPPTFRGPLPRSGPGTAPGLMTASSKRREPWSDFTNSHARALGERLALQVRATAFSAATTVQSSFRRRRCSLSADGPERDGGDGRREHDASSTGARSVVAQACEHGGRVPSTAGRTSVIFVGRAVSAGEWREATWLDVRAAFDCLPPARRRR
jgi:hypothetical protein